MAQGNINISNSSYGKVSDGISVTISNPNGYTITQLGFTFSFKSTNGVKHDFTLQCDQYSGWSDMTATSDGKECYGSVTVNLGSGTSSKSFGLSFSCSWTLSYCQITGVSLDDAVYDIPITYYDHYIYYYKDGAFYTTWSDTNTTESSVYVSLKSLPSTSYYNNGSTNFTITGDKNGGVSNTSLSATKTSQYKKSWSGWYKGSSSTSGTQYSSYTVSGSVSFNAVSSDTFYQYNYSNNTLASLSKPTKNSSTTTYTVTFDPNGGSVSTTSKTATKTTPYTFSHWSSTASGGTTYSDSTAFTSATTVYAQWTTGTPSTTTVTNFPTPTRGQTFSSRIVTFNTNGGSCSTTTATSTNTTSYTFKGWYSATSGGTKYTQITPTSDTTLYAQWTLSSTEYNAITLPTATRTGYNFNGWQDSSGNIYAAGASYTPSATTTLTATWSGQTYQVKYNGNGHTSGSMSNSTHTIDVVSNLSSNSYKKEYILSFDVGYINSSSLLPSEYIQLDYVESDSQQYVDTEHYQTSSSMKIETQFMITENSSWKALWGCEETNSGPWSLTMLMNSASPFTLGIYSGSSPGGSNMGAIPIIENTIHTLSCETNNGTITYSCDENTGILYTDSALCKSKSMYLFTINSAGTGTTGQASKIRIYYFKIYDNNELKRSFIPCKRISDNVPGLYDLITKSFYRSGSGVDLIAGNEITSSGGTIETIDDVKVSYAFQGWYPNADGTGTTITQANNLTTAGNTYNVYAKWLQNSFTLPIPVRSGYNFLGWFDDSGNLITSNSTITSDLILTAQWSEANANKIIIYTNNDWKKAIALIYKNNTWQEYNFNI